MEYEIRVTVSRYDGSGEEVRIYDNLRQINTTKSWYGLFNKVATESFTAAETDEIKLQDECVHTITVDNRCDDCGMHFAEQEAFDKDR